MSSLTRAQIPLLGLFGISADTPLRSDCRQCISELRKNHAQYNQLIVREPA